jgi:class 3 adenylate cyclase
MQQGIDAYNRGAAEPLQVRIGISAGEAVLEDGDYFGDPVVEAARLCSAAQGGQILAAELVQVTAGRRATQTFVALGELSLKGMPEPVTTVEVGWEPLAPVAAVPLPARLDVRPAIGFFGRGQNSNC